MKLNPPSLLPPVGCNLVIMIGDNEHTAQRTGYIENRNDALEYKLDSTGELISGKFFWRYP